MNGFLQIHDPLRPQGHVVGIDLGTTNSLVAAVSKGKAICLPVDDGGTHLLPSVVHYQKSGAVLVGQTAMQSTAAAPSDTIRSVKRLMGKSLSDPQVKQTSANHFVSGTGVVRFEVSGGHPVTPIEVSGEILRTLKRRAEAHFAGKVERAVITVPAYFDDAQRQATKDAGRLAGLDVLRLLNEPTAAALAYGLEKNVQGLYAIYDLGGGTFDVSILELTDGVFQVKSVGGDSALGGDDFDRAIVTHWIETQLQNTPDNDTYAALLLVARSAKEALTTQAEVVTTYQDLSLSLSRPNFESLVAPLIARTQSIVRRALKDANVQVAQVDGVVLVGGSTRVPAVRDAVAALFQKQPLTNLNPDEVVALGAAIQADLLTNAERQDEVLLLDVIPLSLGLETMGGVVEKVIPRNSSIPIAQGQVFTTFQDLQTAMDIHVVQGERELVADCRSLARFKVADIPPMPAGMGRVEVRFAVDADGILSVSATEQTTGNMASVTVKPTHGLSDEEIENMLLDSIEHGEEDMQKRLLAEAQIDARRILLDAHKQLTTQGDLLDTAEKTALVDKMQSLEKLATSSSDAQLLKEAVAALDEAAKPFVERIMNRAIASAAVGHGVEDFS